MYYKQVESLISRNAISGPTMHTIMHDVRMVLSNQVSMFDYSKTRNQVEQVIHRTLILGIAIHITRLSHEDYDSSNIIGVLNAIQQ